MSDLPRSLVNRIQGATEHVELKIETTLTGPLALHLVEEAERRGKQPVELLADLIHAVLRERWFEQVLDDKPPPRSKPGFCLSLGGTVVAAMTAEAERRSVPTANALAATLLTLIASDNLFAAVLDG